MNKHRSIPVIIVIALIQTTWSDDTGKPHSHHGHSHGEGHHATILIPEDPAEVWAHINAYAKVVSEAAAKGDIATVHKEQINLEALIGELGHADNAVPEKKEDRVSGMIKNAKRALEQLHHAADHKDTAGMKKRAKSLAKVIALLRAQYPKEMTGGMAEVKDDIGPHEGMLAAFSGPHGKEAGVIELKLHDDKGDLELWIARDSAIAKPFDIDATEKIVVSFKNTMHEKASLAVRNNSKNEDEDGKPNMREGKTNYFIFPGNSGASADWLKGSKFKSEVTVTFHDGEIAYHTNPFLLIPHGYHGHSHDH